MTLRWLPLHQVGPTASLILRGSEVHQRVPVLSLADGIELLASGVSVDLHFILAFHQARPHRPVAIGHAGILLGTLERLMSFLEPCQTLGKAPVRCLAPRSLQPLIHKAAPIRCDWLHAAHGIVVDSVAVDALAK